MRDVNIQRGFLEGRPAPVARLGGEAGAALSRLFGETGQGRAGPGSGSPGGGPPRVPDRDIVVIGRGARPPEALHDAEAGKSGPEQHLRRARVRRTILLALAAYYMGWGLYTGIGSHKARPIYVNPTLNGRTVIT